MRHGEIPKTVEELVNFPVPDKVWHYTTVDALKGILQSQRIWATEVRFTNDLEEFIHARKVAQEFLDEWPSNDPRAASSKERGLDILGRVFDHGPLSKDTSEIWRARSFVPLDELV